MQAPDTQAAVDVQAVAQLVEASGSSSVSRSQSSSVPLQRSGAPGKTIGSPSLQSSGPQPAPSEEKPSPSASVQVAKPGGGHAKMTDRRQMKMDTFGLGRVHLLSQTQIYTYFDVSSPDSFFWSRPRPFCGREPGIWD